MIQEACKKTIKFLLVWHKMKELAKRQQTSDQFQMLGADMCILASRKARKPVKVSKEPKFCNKHDSGHIIQAFTPQSHFSYKYLIVLDCQY